MSFVRILFSVIMLSSVANGNSGFIQDLSNECEKNETVRYYLSTGFGESDATALMIASDKQFSCVLVFYVQPKSFVNMVIEFPDLGEFDSVCIIEENSVVMVSEFHGQNKCEIITNGGAYSKVSKQYAITQIKSEGNLTTAKVTATTLRLINSSTCTDSQVYCLIDENYYCMSSVLVCDGNKNCGSKIFSDEKGCGQRTLPLLMIMFSIAMTLTTIWIISSILNNIFPKRRRTFIYRTDQKMSPYDSQFSSLQIEVIVHVVFPPETNRNMNASQVRRSTLKKVKF